MQSDQRQNSSTIERLESRSHCDATPLHLTLAEQLVAGIQPAQNVYSYGTPLVTWAGRDGATTYSNSSDCSTFVTALLKEAYGFTTAQDVAWTGFSSPQAKDYYAAAVADRGFLGFQNVAAVQPGDELFIKFLDSTTDTGHCATIVSAPTLVGVTSSERIYNLTVIDCTASPHTDDTRTNGQTGVGEGIMRIYSDLNNNLIAYSWGTSDASVVETASERPAIFAEIPVPEPSSIAACLVAFGLARRPIRHLGRRHQASRRATNRSSGFQ